MQVSMNKIIPPLTPSVRELPVSLKLENVKNNQLPLSSNEGYIINPKKYEQEVKAAEINLDEIRNLLLMMLKGNPSFISNLIKMDDHKFVDTRA